MTRRRCAATSPEMLTAGMLTSRSPALIRSAAEGSIRVEETAEVGLNVICKDQGSTQIVSRFLAKVDQDSLFPSGRTEKHQTDVEVA